MQAKGKDKDQRNRKRRDEIIPPRQDLDNLVKH